MKLKELRKAVQEGFYAWLQLRNENEFVVLFGPSGSW